MRVRGGTRRYAVGAGLAVLLAFVAMVLASGSAQAAPSDDLATRFHVDITVNDDGSLDVAENITWHFPEGEDRHGIERFVTVRVGYQDRQDTYREYPISQVSASSPSGAPADVSVNDATDGSSVRIRVGRADKTVSGTQTYVVRYHLDAYVNGFPDHAELYYNLVDASDDNTYQDVSATVTGASPSDRAECFIGEFGSTQRCTATPGASAEFSAPEAGNGRGVSILASLPIGDFGSLDPVLHEGEVSRRRQSHRDGHLQGARGPRRRSRSDAAAAGCRAHGNAWSTRAGATRSTPA